MLLSTKKLSDHSQEIMITSTKMASITAKDAGLNCMIQIVNLMPVAVGQALMMK